MISIPGYQIGECVHEGKTTSVFRAVRDDGAKVYVKALRAARPTPGQIAWLRREFEIQRDLEGSGVAKAHQLEQHGASCALIVEDFGGQSLDRLLRDCSFSLVDRLLAAIGTTAAVRQLHAKRTIHKHISPANIVWNPEMNTIKLIDLGIATVLSREAVQLRSPESIEGTLAYLSPEQTGRLNRAIDNRSDFYSLGATLYELFTGAPPFRSDDPVEIVHCHIARRPTEPREIDPSIPRVVSDIVMRLLEKMPENRYQSSFGLQADLERCLEQANGGGSIEPFPLGSRDVVERFQVPQVLYGRDKELGALLSAFEEVAKGSRAGLALVTGYSGVGKSTLVKELYKPITERRGYFISGKFEQLQRATPYSALVAALTSLMRQILGESESALAGHRQRLLDAVGTNGRVLFDVVPELELIIGPQPPVAQLEPQEAQNRFNRVFSEFIRVFAQPSHPLAIFLDDLQWADSGSLKLIERLLGDDEPQCLLVIGTYRVHEVGPDHPLHSMVDALAKEGLSIRRIPLAPLELADVTRLVADTLARPMAEVAELGRIVAQKTEGNPLFVTELLKSLHDEGLLTFDRAAGSWVWNAASIAARNIADNVVELMIGKLRRLPEATQQTVQLAACLGGSFDLDTLAISKGTSAPEAFRQIFPAIQEGFVVGGSDLIMADAADPESPFVVSDLKFTHDRVQQAAYQLMDEAERGRVHLDIGRRLLAAGFLARPNGTFQIADQKNRARALIEAGPERTELARLNLVAARQARKALAYAAAKSYLECGIDCLPEESFRDLYDLAFGLHKELCEVGYLNGDYEASEALCKRVMIHARTAIDRAELYVALVTQYTIRARYDDALTVARTALGLLGVDLPLRLPDAEFDIAIDAEDRRLRTLLGDRKIASLYDEPEMADPTALTVSSLLLKILPASFFTTLVPYRFVVFKAIGTLLEYGPSPRSCDLFSNYGHILAGAFEEYDRAYEFGRLAVALSDRFGRPDCKCRSVYHLANASANWCRPLSECAALNEVAFKAGVDGGDMIYTCYTLVWQVYTHGYMHRPLEEMASEIQTALRLSRRVRNSFAIDNLHGMALLVENLLGRTPSSTHFSYGGLDEQAHLEQCAANQSTMAAAFYAVFKAEVLCVYGDFEGVLETLSKAAPILPLLMGNTALAYAAFYEALGLAAMYETARDKAKSRDRLREISMRFEKWAAACGENYAHMHALVCAEIDRIDGKKAEVFELYEQAIEGARRGGFIQHAALAAELAAKFWLARGREELAMGYLRGARDAYRQRGALRKVELLERQHPTFFEPHDPIHRSLPDNEPAVAAPAASNLDLRSILKVSQAITSEIDLDRLLSKLMLILLENAGARQGAIVFEKSGDLRVEVHATVDETNTEGATSTVVQSIPIGDYPSACEAIIRYVARTKESVILGDATREGAFTLVPYIVRTKAKSLLCGAVMNGGRMVAIVYLENNLTSGAFTPERLEVLRLLSSQIATSLDIALLHRELETRVALRTSELHQRNEELSRALSELRQAQTQLVQAEKMASLGRLTMGIAHELKNPLNFIVNFAAIEDDLVSEMEEAIEHGAGSLSTASNVRETMKDLKKMAVGIREHGMRANDIIQSMMRHATGMSGERRATRLDDLLDQAIRLALEAPRAANSDIRVERDYDAGIGDVVVVQQEILRVCINLLENAVDAVVARQRLGERGYTPTIRVSARREGGSMIIRVHDTGAGIAPSILPRVFEPFFTTKPPGKGIGLGLSLTYDIVVHGHHGAIKCESVEGQGTTFVITLPA